MSLEVLKIIILACQVSAGGDHGFKWTWIDVDNYQKQCQKKLIKCYEDSASARASYAVRNCLKRR